ncbi:MAG: hypothetical protein JNL69_06005, partial [Bacteroidia bacterium]|nr:hypothetical protein [Bacteroidia bacterium]
KKNPKRIVFEYAHDCKFVLKYNNELNMIVFDRLSAIDPKLEGQYQYYCTTDFEYDGFKIKKNKWLFTENIEPKNEKSRTDKLYNNPNTADSKNSNQLIDDNLKIENGKVVKKENKDKSKKSSSKD